MFCALNHRMLWGSWNNTDLLNVWRVELNQRGPFRKSVSTCSHNFPQHSHHPVTAWNKIRAQRLLCLQLCSICHFLLLVLENSDLVGKKHTHTCTSHCECYITSLTYESLSPNCLVLPTLLHTGLRNSKLQTWSCYVMCNLIPNIPLFMTFQHWMKDLLCSCRTAEKKLRRKKKNSTVEEYRSYWPHLGYDASMTSSSLASRSLRASRFSGGLMIVE